MTDTASRGDPTTEQGKLDEAKDQVQEKAQQVTGQARERARGMIDERSTQMGDQIGQQARDVRSIAESLREQGKDGPAKMAEQAADRAEKLGSYLSESDGQSILRDVERVARDNPWAVMAGGVVLGFAASRFLKASSRERYRSSSSDFGQRAQIPRSTGAIGTPTPESARSGLAGGGYSMPPSASEAPGVPPGSPSAPGTGSPPLQTPGATSGPGTVPSRDPVRSR
jgi:hypothetical protein